MKRTVFGLLVMGSLVGVGSVGVYYAQGKLAPSAEAPAGDTAHEDSRTPQPIPVARQVTPSADPYAAQAASAPVADRYSDADYPIAEQPVAADDIPAADAGAPADDYAQEIVDAPIAAQPAGGDIPDAEPVAAAPPSASPFAARDSAAVKPNRYAEQPAAAEMVAEPQPTPAAPRPLAAAAQAAPAALEAQPTGNPLRANLDAAAPADAVPGDRYTAEPAAAPAAQPYPDEQPYPGEEIGAAPLAAQALPNDSYSTAQVEPASEGTGRPGDPQLNGAQAPSLVIEKTAPPEVQIGKPAKFLIKVRNVGTAAAHEVEIHDSVPQGTQLIDTVPPAGRGPDGQLTWELGTLKPGEEHTAELQLMPTAEGEIGSVATVHFHAQASVRTLATKPMLAIEVLGPSKVHKGQQVSLRVKLSNPGSGSANGIMISESVPQGLTHAAGRELEFEVGTLKPGETRELDLALMAAEPGEVVNVIRAEGEASLVAEAQTTIEVVAPQLQVSLTGPKLRYLERNATHNISVTNPGTAPAKNIDLVAVLPRNLKFVEANNGGQWDEATHAVYWNLEELPPQETGTVKLTTLPLEAGDARLLIKSTSTESGLKDEREETVAIEGLAAINFQLADLKDPIEVNGETSYEIRVTNQGSKAASNVRLAALLPRGMKPLSAEAPVRYQIEGQRVVFEPLRQLAAKADTAYTIKVQATEVGDHRIEVQVATDEIRDPISKEESTRVYGDE